jgi:hypothetical protein
MQKTLRPILQPLCEHERWLYAVIYNDLKLLLNVELFSRRRIDPMASIKTDLS